MILGAIRHGDRVAIYRGDFYVQFKNKLVRVLKQKHPTGTLVVDFNGSGFYVHESELQFLSCDEFETIMLMLEPNWDTQIP
jgi:hypothetical protein